MKLRNVHQMWNPMNSDLPLSSFDLSTGFIFICQHCLTHQIYISLKIFYYHLREKRYLCRYWHLIECLVIQSSKSQYSYHLPPPHHTTHRSNIFNQHDSEFSPFSLEQYTMTWKFFHVISHPNTHGIYVLENLCLSFWSHFCKLIKQSTKFILITFQHLQQ